MKVFSGVVSKKIKLPTGKEIERKANYTVRLPETAEEMLELLNGSSFLWASHGLRSQAKILAGNKLLGSAGDKKLKKSLRQFKESLRTLTSVMEMAESDAVSFLLQKKQFETVSAHFKQLEAEGNEISVNFDTEAVPFPRWFGFDTEKKSFAPDFGVKDEDSDSDSDDEPDADEKDE